MVNLVTTTTALLSLVTSSAAWFSFMANEFKTDDCKGGVVHAHVGMKYWQIPLDNETNSVYVQTANDGIFKWYAFADSVPGANACQGDPLGELKRGCAALRLFGDKIRCLRWCSSWVDDEYSCKAIEKD
ncbi:hypothetical protein F4779DRAFT_19940 [Xylariaceae sp. FL0662B]|nr:hypothetical protein F4779DRAFT_19940 [Xylariaceae sp. FL0662B]